MLRFPPKQRSAGANDNGNPDAAIRPWNSWTHSECTAAHRMDSSVQLIALFPPSLSCKPESTEHPQFLILLLSLSDCGCVPHPGAQPLCSHSATLISVSHHPSSFRAVKKWRMDWISVSLWEKNLLMRRAELVPYSSASSRSYGGCRAHGGTSAPLQKSNGAQNELWM